MIINKKLNLVIPIYQEGDRVLYVHSAPILRETFERYFMVLSRAFTLLYSKGLGVMAGPRVAALLIKQVAVAEGEWEGPLGVERGLIAEFHRLSNVIVPTERGWQPVPLDEAIKSKLIDAEDIAEVENAIGFFMLASSMHRKDQLKGTLEAAAELWSAQITSLDSTEFLSSLPTLTPPANSGEKAIPSSIPS